MGQLDSGAFNRSRNRQGGVGAPYNSLDVIRSQQWQRVGLAFLRLRPLLVGLTLLCVTPLLWFSSTPLPQRHRLMVGFVVMLSFFVWEAWDVHRRGLSATRLFVSLLITIAGITMAGLNSGGLSSVIIPLWLAPVVVGFAAYGRTWRSFVLAAAVVCAALLFFLLPAGLVLAPLPDSITPISRVLIICLSLTLSFVGVVGLVEAHERTGVLVDEARQETIRAIEDRNRDMVVLSAQLAHEIKNPLTAIKGLVQLSLRQASPKDTRRLEVMATELDRLETLTRDYLKLSVPVDLEQCPEVDVRGLVVDVVSLLTPQYDGVAFDVVTGDSVMMVKGHEEKLRQVLLNVLLNAIDAVDAMGSVGVVMGSDGADHVISIRDSGDGFSESARAQFGTPFFSTRAQGTGLGVMVAQTLLSQHGGALVLCDTPTDSTMWSGAHLEVRLPGVFES